MNFSKTMVLGDKDMNLLKEIDKVMELKDTGIMMDENF